MCGNYGTMGGKLKTQKLFDCALLRVRVCAVITVLRAVNWKLRNYFTVRL